VTGNDPVIKRVCHKHGRLYSGQRCPGCVREREAKQGVWSSSAWQRARKAARVRDGNRCVECGETHGLGVHHVVPLGEGGERTALSNLATLCDSCHARAERGRGVGVSREPMGGIPQPASSLGEKANGKPRRTEIGHGQPLVS
jgi:HNH endonuclease